MHVAGAPCIVTQGQACACCARDCACQWPAHSTQAQACACCAGSVHCVRACTGLAPCCSVVLCMCDSCAAAAIAALWSLHHICVLVCMHRRFSWQQLVFQCAVCVVLCECTEHCASCPRTDLFQKVSHKPNHVVAAFVVVCLWADCGGERVWSVEGSGYQLKPQLWQQEALAVEAIQQQCGQSINQG